jgi:hypothetical protein
MCYCMDMCCENSFQYHSLLMSIECQVRKSRGFGRRTKTWRLKTACQREGRSGGSPSFSERCRLLHRFYTIAILLHLTQPLKLWIEVALDGRPMDATATYASSPLGRCPGSLVHCHFRILGLHHLNSLRGRSQLNRMKIVWLGRLGGLSANNTIGTVAEEEKTSPHKGEGWRRN